jgi:hypothetical protein
MKHLITYLIESIDDSGKFDKTADSLKKLMSLAPKLTIKEFPEIQDKFNQFSSNNKIFIYATGKSYFKMPYFVGPELEKIFSNVPNIMIKRYEGKKIKLYYKGKQIMELGSGSINKIPTSVQEHLTCGVFNSYMDEIENCGDLSLIEDESYISNFVQDLFDGTNMDKSWIESFKYQVKSLVDYIYIIIGDLNINTSAYNYRLVPYNETGKNSKISKAYRDMVSTYSKKLGGRKDVYDPSDLILFDKTEINHIIDYCKKGKDEDECKDIKNKFNEEIFNKGLCMGISLKKLHEDGRITLYNTGNNEIVKSINSYEIKKTSGKNNVTVLCKGIFNMDRITDMDKDVLLQTKEVLLTMRTFGSGILALDVTLSSNGKLDGPSIGKCPSKIWRVMIGAENDNIENSVKKFEEFIKTKASLEDIKILIQGAMKEGLNCFPFILLH